MTYEVGDEIVMIKGGKVGVIQSINPNKNYEADDETWAEVEWYNGDFHDVDSESEVRLSRKAADIPPRSIPTTDDLLNFISMALLDDYSGISITETDRDSGGDSVEVYGTNETGQAFSAVISIKNIRWADR